MIIDTYQKNHPEVKVIVDDIKNIDAAGTFKLGDADVIIGGPPCQGFSMAGARIRHGFIDDPRNYLFKHYFNVVRTVKPKVFVMENVKGMQNMQRLSHSSYPDSCYDSSGLYSTNCAFLCFKQ